MTISIDSTQHFTIAILAIKLYLCIANDNNMYSERRRYNSYNSYFENIFGGRAQKISIDAGFNCPNRDGKISTEGCSFCRNDAFNPSYCNKTKPIVQQIEEGIEFHKKDIVVPKHILLIFNHTATLTSLLTNCLIYIMKHYSMRVLTA